jgi:hypothetical protein
MVPRKFDKAFMGTLEKLIRQRGLLPGMAITIMGNLNMHGKDMPSEVLSHLDYRQGFEVPGDSVVLAEALKRIREGKVVIPKPLRAELGGDMRLQFNLVRAFRPRRRSSRTDVGLSLRFQPRQFNYSCPACDEEVFATQELYGGRLSADFLYNRYPFAPYHFLWVPERKGGHHRQYLDPNNNNNNDNNKDAQIIEEMFTLVDSLGDSVRLCYNCTGSHSSVNHLHCQGFFVTEDWKPPFERLMQQQRRSGPVVWHLRGTQWLHRGKGRRGIGNLVAQMKSRIADMNRRDEAGEKVAYNFCVSTKGVAWFPRRHQRDETYFRLLEEAPFTSGFGFLEMMGEIVSATQDISIFNLEAVRGQIERIYAALAL